MKAIVVMLPVALLHICTLALADDERKATDGTPLPAPLTQDRRIDIDLPFIGTTLGALPEKLTPRLFNGATSAKLAARLRVDRGKNVWFAPNQFGATVVRFGIAYGRVNSVSLVFNAMSERQRKAMQAHIAKAAGGDPKEIWRTARAVFDGVPVTINVLWQSPIGAKSKLVRTTFMFYVSPIEWYIRHVMPSDEIAKAMRERRVVKGMNTGQVLLVLGNPASSTETDLHKVMVWTSYNYGERISFHGFNASTIPIKRLKKRVIVSFIANKVVSVTVEKFGQ